jgi:hypothetical protein
MASAIALAGLRSGLATHPARGVDRAAGVSQTQHGWWTVAQFQYLTRGAPDRNTEDRRHATAACCPRGGFAR